jgi:hypothetical protein
MKTLLKASLILLVMLAFYQQCKSQYFGEVEPFIVSDYDKQNAVMGYAAQELGFLLIWEQLVDSESTAIVYQRYLTNDPPVTLIAEQGLHFRNPKLYHSPYGYFDDSTGIIFYEKVVGETTGLYYIKLAPDGGQSAPYALAIEGNTNNLFALSSNDIWLAYHSNGHLLAFNEKQIGGMPSFSTPDTIFTGEITDIKITFGQLFWLAQHNDSTSLMMSQYANSWSDPVVLKTEKEISTIGGTSFMENAGWISYTYTVSNKWYINNVRRSWGMDEEYPLEIESDSIFDYDAFSTWIAVKGYDPELYYCAFIRDTAGAREVFMNYLEIGWLEDYQLSNLGTECRNPKFFLGESCGGVCSWGYLIWEAYIDGHWQIYRARAPFSWSSIHEQQQPEGVSVSPNPARDFLRIQNSQELALDIKIVDISGRLVFETMGENVEISVATSQWPRGVYILSATAGARRLTQKIVIE